MLYEALMFGLPVMVSIQSMPYIGLQYQPFVTLTVTCGVRCFTAIAVARADGVRAAPDTRHRRDRARRGRGPRHHPINTRRTRTARPPRSRHIYDASSST